MNRVRSWFAVWLALALAVAAWLYAGAVSTPQAPTASPLDGSYAKIEDGLVPQWWLCKRCADFRPAGGIWRLRLSGGELQLDYAVTGWGSVSHYEVRSDQLVLRDDVHCPGDVGRYRWSFQSGQLRLSLIEDACSFGLRAETLTRTPWRACPAADGPAGCSDPAPPAAEIASAVRVQALGGDSRFFARPPDTYLPANADDSPAPAGVQVTAHPDSVGYGLSRVLWWGGNWVEVTSDQASSYWGVQFHGDPAIGWARLLFDGEEVWRGDTAAVWSAFGRHALYVEVEAITPGRHSLRVESMNFDYRAVTVAGFGFSGEPTQP